MEDKGDNIGLMARLIVQQAKEKTALEIETTALRGRVAALEKRIRPFKRFVQETRRVPGHWGLGAGMGNAAPTVADVRALVVALLTAPPAAAERPKVVCLCGSTRFKAAYIDWMQRLTDEGYIVLTVGRFLPRPQHELPHKAALDELHLRKIDLADEILVLDLGGYVGESTRREIAYAERAGKRVRLLSEAAPEYVEPPLAETDIGIALLGEPAAAERDCPTCNGEGVVGPRMIAEEPCCNCGGSGRVPTEAAVKAAERARAVGVTDDQRALEPRRLPR